MLLCAAGKRCAELGSGAGLLGICLHRMGVQSLLLTDGDAQSLSNCRHNLSLNRIGMDAGSQAMRLPPVSLTGHLIGHLTAFAVQLHHT